MKKLIILFLISIGIIINFTGCSTGQGQPQIYQINNTTQKQIVIKLNFPKKDPITNNKMSFNKEHLLKILTKNIINYSQYNKFKATEPYDIVRHYAGIKINVKQNYIEIDYANGELNNHSWYLNKVIFKIPYTINKKYIILNYPKNFTYIPCNNVIGATIEPLDNINNIKKDIYRIFQKLSQKKLYISKTYHLKKEINSPYNSDSIYANFKRLLGEYNDDYWHGDEFISPTEKKNYFALKVGNEIYSLKIKVYPYRNKSKVLYEAYIPYKIYSDGTVIPNLTKIEKEIINIINN